MFYPFIDLVEVKIRAEARIRFCETTKVPRAVLKKYEEMCEKGASDRDFTKLLEPYIRADDLDDMDDFTDMGIEQAEGSQAVDSDVIAAKEK